MMLQSVAAASYRLLTLASSIPHNSLKQGVATAAPVFLLC
jgi:hypothetical protein